MSATLEAGNSPPGFEIRALPDIVLMDVRMPVMDGVEATRIIKQRHPEILIITLTTFDGDTYVEKTLQYGAVGYLLKNIPPAELIASIRAARKGAVLMDSSIAARLVRKAYQGAPEESEGATMGEASSGIDSLSQREREVLRLLARGLGNRQICERLSIADSTVRNHITMIYSKLDVHDRYTAMQIAIQAGIV
jgi:DNA-binding NarL/FixJ family response regulator